MWVRTGLVVMLVAVLLTGCGFRRKKYENPITKDTEQPDKVLFDKAIKDIEKGRYEVARLTLNTLMNTYDTSEYMAKAKLAIADSWMREGGSHSLAQAEAEYKDFILFYPTMEESAEAQEKVCMIHYKQMEKPDRDTNHAVRAEDECRNLLQQFPNSKFAPRVAQTLRNIQEVIAEGEFRVGEFYFKKRSYPSAANRLEAMVNHYPLFSQADEAWWMVGESFGKLGPRFRDRSANAYQKIVRDYPLSARVDEAKNRLKEMEKEIPDPDPVALARMKYEKENYIKPGMMSPFWGIFRKSPDVSLAAKSGNPALTGLRPGIPVSVPSAETAGAAGATADVTVSTVGPNSALDTKPDARANTPGQQQQGSTEGSTNNVQGASSNTQQSGTNASSTDQTPAGQQQPQGKAKKSKKAKK
ncbi:MAG: outer membrane protein assembly factor BamD [Bryobacterales bacterium]|nr:outer membrane protein assembly factor BamD [Bryobacterales bacterium]